MTISENIQKIAKTYKAQGFFLHINLSLPYIALNDTNNKTVFFAQEHEAELLLKEADILVSEFDISRDEAIYCQLYINGVID